MKFFALIGETLLAPSLLCFVSDTLPTGFDVSFKAFVPIRLSDPLGLFCLTALAGPAQFIVLCVPWLLLSVCLQEIPRWGRRLTGNVVFA